MNLDEFVDMTGDLLATEEVLSMGQWGHHGDVSCLDHSLFVATVSSRIGKVFGLDASAVARAGLLHDLYLYHKRDKSAHEGWQCFDHPKIACENAGKITELSQKEENIIKAHMWPCGGEVPRSLEAVLVNVVDTACAFFEFSKIYRPQKITGAIFGDKAINNKNYSHKYL